jgi:hypothetical protein
MAIGADRLPNRPLVSAFADLFSELQKTLNEFICCSAPKRPVVLVEARQGVVEVRCVGGEKSQPINFGSLIFESVIQDLEEI